MPIFFGENGIRFVLGTVENIGIGTFSFVFTSLFFGSTLMVAGGTVAFVTVIGDDSSFRDGDGRLTAFGLCVVYVHGGFSHGWLLGNGVLHQDFFRVTMGG